MWDRGRVMFIFVSLMALASGCSHLQTRSVPFIEPDESGVILMSYDRAVPTTSLVTDRTWRYQVRGLAPYIPGDDRALSRVTLSLEVKPTEGSCRSCTVDVGLFEVENDDSGRAVAQPLGNFRMSGTQAIRIRIEELPPVVRDRVTRADANGLAICPAAKGTQDAQLCSEARPKFDEQKENGTFEVYIDEQGTLKRPLP